MDKRLGKAVPYWIYDLAVNVGWASPDTAVFPVPALRSWWNTIGAQRYPRAGAAAHLSAAGWRARDGGAGASR